VQNTVFSFLSFSERCSETRSLFAKREAKTLIRMLRVLTQSAETAVSAGGAGARSHHEFFRCMICYTSAVEKNLINPGYNKAIMLIK
jgi:hypothetical protein